VGRAGGNGRATAASAAVEVMTSDRQDIIFVDLVTSDRKDSFFEQAGTEAQQQPGEMKILLSNL